MDEVSIVGVDLAKHVFQVHVRRQMEECCSVKSDAGFIMHSI